MLLRSQTGTETFLPVLAASSGPRESRFREAALELPSSLKWGREEMESRPSHSGFRAKLVLISCPPPAPSRPMSNPLLTLSPARQHLTIPTAPCDHPERSTLASWPPYSHLPLQTPRGHMGSQNEPVTRRALSLSCLHTSDGFCPMRDNFQRSVCGLERSTNQALHLASSLACGPLTPPHFLCQAHWAPC